jgi:hypothetical protein
MSMFVDTYTENVYDVPGRYGTPLVPAADVLPEASDTEVVLLMLEKLTQVGLTAVTAPAVVAESAYAPVPPVYENVAVAPEIAAVVAALIVT